METNARNNSILDSFISSILVIAKKDEIYNYYINGNSKEYLVLDDLLEDVFSAGNCVLKNISLSAEQKSLIEKIFCLMRKFEQPEYKDRANLFENEQWKSLVVVANDILNAFGLDVENI